MTLLKRLRQTGEQPSLAQTGVLNAVKHLASKSAVYGMGSVLIRGISFLLLPLYTRYLTPGDYGIITVTTTITTILGILYPLGLHGSLTRFYFEVEDEGERRQRIGTLWLAIILGAFCMALLLDSLGGAFFDQLFREVPFAPYIRLAIWIAFFTMFGLLPLNLLQIQERSGLYVLTTAVSTLLTIGSVIWLVVYQGQGAYGYLLGILLANGLLVAPYIIFILRHIQFKVRWDILKIALAFSLPLVPHALAGWVLELSDRVILERYVSLAELGIYGLGYQFGLIMSMVAAAINAAWVPFLFKTAADRGDAAKPELARLATYYTLFLSFVALALILFVKEMIYLLTAPAFHGAAQVAPWIIGGWLLSGLYYIPVNFLFLKSKTGWVPVATVLAGLVNIGLNLWLAPHYGVMAAAWSTFIAYGLMLILVWKVALPIYPFPYEYKRLAIIMLTTASLSILGMTAQFNSIAISIGVKGALLLLYPVILIFLGFLTTPEKKGLAALYGRLWP